MATKRMSAPAGSRKKIVLVYPGQEATFIQKHIHIHLPLAVLQLGAFLMPRGYEVIIYDTRVQKFEEIDFSGALAIGFSTMTNPQIQYCLNTAERLRRDGFTGPFIWGGVHPTLFPEQTLAHRHVDMVVRKEGEETLFEVLEALHGGATDFSEIAGLTWLDPTGKVVSNAERVNLSMDSIPRPAYGLVDIGRYPKVLTMFDYQTSRGCPFRCAFCYIQEVHDRRWRARSATEVADDLEELVHRYGVRKFAFVDDELFIDRHRVEALCDALIARNLNIEWNASCRLDIVQKYSTEQMKKVKRSGCNRLYFGAESGSDRILKIILKDLTVEQIVKGVEWVIQNDIIPIVSLMGGFRQETLEETQMTFRLAERIWKIDPRVEVNGIFFFNPYPGNPLYYDAVEKGGFVPPVTLEGWATFGFDYDGAQPWMTARHAQILRSIFYMVRSRYYIQELWGRPGYKAWERLLFSFVNSPLTLSRKLRMKYEYYEHTWEWQLWAAIMKRTFGFL